jgi:iron uptake system EfeUOB component EfeO/EfeM
VRPTLLLLSLAAACCLAGPAGAAAVQRRTVTVAANGCAGGSHGWPAPHSGRTVFTVRNTTADNYFLVQVVAGNSASTDPRYGFFLGRVYGELGVVAPRTTVAMDVVLPPGTYFFRCLDRTGALSVSRVEPVRGAAVKGAHPYEPLSGSQLPLAMLRYRVAVAPILKRLGPEADRLARAVQAGHLHAARALWLTAHLDYARLGAAYGTFGALDSQIVDGLGSLEHGLWHGRRAARLTPTAASLRQAVHTLQRRAAATKTIWVDTDLPLRAHEILENTLQFELTGRTNEGSGTNLATAWANAQGTMLTLQALRPLLQHGRDPKLAAQAVRQTSRLAGLYASFRRPSGVWRPLGSLSRRERERLDSRTSALLETLEQIPGGLKAFPSSPSSTE